MTIRRIDPDEAVTINGVQVTGRQLAEARQELSHRGVYNPRWSELTEQEQGTAALAAGSYVRSLADLVPSIAAPAETRTEWAARANRYDGTVNHQIGSDREHAELMADSMTTHLDSLNEPTRRAGGVECRRPGVPLGDGHGRRYAGHPAVAGRAARNGLRAESGW